MLFLICLGEGTLKNVPSFILTTIAVAMLLAIFCCVFLAIPYYFTVKSHFKKSSVTINDSNLVYTFVNNNLNYYVYNVRNVDNVIIKNNILIIEGIITRNRYLEGNEKIEDISLLKIPLVFENINNIYKSEISY